MGVYTRSTLSHFPQLNWMIHRIELIWRPVILQRKERVASVVRAPTSITPITELR